MSPNLASLLSRAGRWLRFAHPNSKAFTPGPTLEPWFLPALRRDPGCWGGGRRCGWAPLPHRPQLSTQLRLQASAPPGLPLLSLPWETPTSRSLAPLLRWLRARFRGWTTLRPRSQLGAERHPLHDPTDHTRGSGRRGPDNCLGLGAQGLIMLAALRAGTGGKRRARVGVARVLPPVISPVAEMMMARTLGRSGHLARHPSPPGPRRRRSLPA